MNVDSLRKLFGRLPVGIAVAGRKREVVFRGLDRFLSNQVSSSIKTTKGEIKIDPDHEPERYLAYVFENVYRYYSLSPLGLYISSLDRGMFVDVGSNLGLYSMIARRNGLTPLAIEPDPAHFRFLDRNSELVGESLNIGCSDSKGSLPLYYEARNPGATSLFEGVGSIRSEFDVEVDTLSSVLLGPLAGRHLDVELVKIDVEGFEAAVAKGMKDFLETGHRPDIWCEVRGDRSPRNGGSYREVIDYFGSFGYDAFDARSSSLGPVSGMPFERLGIVDVLFRARDV